MRRTVLKSKLHRATVTGTYLEYEGSLTIDLDLLEAADILPHEQIHVWDVTNGTRLVTYALPGERGTGIVQVNGAGAHLIQAGDVVIVATFTELKTRAAKRWEPVVVFVGEGNKPKGLPPEAAGSGEGTAAAPIQVAEHNGDNGKAKKRKKQAG
jgi:aspartate 1-decarboxylase